MGGRAWPAPARKHGMGLFIEKVGISSSPAESVQYIVINGSACDYDAKKSRGSMIVLALLHCVSRAQDSPDEKKHNDLHYMTKGCNERDIRVEKKKRRQSMSSPNADDRMILPTATATSYPCPRRARWDQCRNLEPRFCTSNT